MSEQGNNNKDMMSATEFYSRFIEIWQNSETRQEVVSKVNAQLDPSLTYKQVLGKAKYAKSRGIPLKELQYDTANWSQLRGMFGTAPRRSTDK